MMIKILASALGLFALVGGGALVIDSSQDTDADGVADITDKCPATVPDTITGEWGVNRHLWFEGPSFTVLLPEGSKVASEYSIAQTKGCSCMDLLAMKGGSDSSGQNKMGCTNGTLKDWVNTKK